MCKVRAIAACKQRRKNVQFQTRMSLSKISPNCYQCFRTLYHMLFIAHKITKLKLIRQHHFNISVKNCKPTEISVTAVPCRDIRLTNVLWVRSVCQSLTNRPNPYHYFQAVVIQTNFLINTFNALRVGPAFVMILCQSLSSYIRQLPTVP